MSNAQKPSELLAQIRLPKRELQRFSFCRNTKPATVQEWIDNLKATQVVRTSTQLYRAVPEVVRIQTDFQNRLEILERFRPPVQYAILGLQKKFLHQPIILPEPAQKAVLIAQSLQKYMIDGYLATIVQITERGRPNKNTFDQLAKAIHRAITGIGLLFLRNYQIFARPPRRLWQVLHILYRIAQFYQLTRHPVKDPLMNSAVALNIEAAYARVLMLEAAKTNQLSQNDILMASNVFESWCQAMEIHWGLTGDKENFFAVDLESDRGPVYKSGIKQHDDGVYVELDFTALLNQISKQSTESLDVIQHHYAVTVPKEFPKLLLSHLINAWSNVSHRKHDRRAIATSADICIGLSDCHYFVCNEQNFDYFLRSAGAPENQRINAFSKTASFDNDHDEIQQYTSIYRVTIENISAGGLCLMWRDDSSSKIGAGELIGFREVGKRLWSLGVIRWVQQLKNASRMGVELLSEKPKPYAVAQNYDTGGYSDFMRAMFIPPSKPGLEHPTLLTASAPLQSADKVKIVDGDNIWRAKLEKQLLFTKNIQLFAFKNVETVTEQATRADLPSKSFDSSWD